MHLTVENSQYCKNISSCTDQGQLLALVREVFALEADGKPLVTNGQVLYEAWQALKRLAPEHEADVMQVRFDKGRDERFRELIEPLLVQIDPVRFEMGSHAESEYIYCGEEPRHTVQLSPYRISRITVTNELYRLYDPTHDLDLAADLPVINVTWYDAVMFCRWAGVRLPSEAEWEYAAQGGHGGLFGCETDELPEHAWYSHNSKGLVQPVALKKANGYGLHDMHGNVWEWCLDSYEVDFYSRSPLTNPVNDAPVPNKICRGGSMHAFFDMCRSAFRHHEPIDYWAYDVGFRVVRD
jgi:formylglycine-generating enzyme